MDKSKLPCVKQRRAVGAVQAPSRKGRKLQVQSMLVTRKSSSTAMPCSAKHTSTPLAATTRIWCSSKLLPRGNMACMAPRMPFCRLSIAPSFIVLASTSTSTATQESTCSPRVTPMPLRPSAHRARPPARPPARPHARTPARACACTHARAHARMHRESYARAHAQPGAEAGGEEEGDKGGKNGPGHDRFRGS